MSCCVSNNFEPFYLPPQVQVEAGHLASREVRDLTRRISQSITRSGFLPSETKACPAVRMIVIAMVVVAIAVYFLAITGKLTTFPQNFVQGFQQINWANFGVGMAVATVLTAGAAIVIHRAKNQIDPITEKKMGKIWGDDHWVSAVFLDQRPPPSDDASERRQRTLYFQGYIDTSSLDEHRSGTAFVYGNKSCSDHYGVSTIVSIVTPLHAIGAIVYNIFRAIAMPFYITGCLLTERFIRWGIEPTDIDIRLDPTEGERAFKWSDIPKQLVDSVRRIAIAPFCAVSIIFASLYSFIDPMNGRKLGSYVERYWNDGVTRAQGYWSVNGPQALWRFEGGGSPNGLGRNGFYVAGCWQPMAVCYYENGKIIRATSLSRVFNSAGGREYKMMTRESLLEENREAHHELTTMLAQLDSQEAVEASA